MLPQICLSFDKLLPRRRKKDARRTMETKMGGGDLRYASVTCARKPDSNTIGFPLRSERRDRNEEIRERKKEMANKVPHISDLIHRVASSCLTHHLPGAHGLESGNDVDGEIEEEEDAVEKEEEQEEEEENELKIWEEEKGTGPGGVSERVREMEYLMGEVFDAVSAAKRAYACLQDAHCPWDTDKMRVADTAVVAQLRRLGRLRDRFRRNGFGASAAAAAPLREVVAPYEAALEDLKRDLKAKEAEVESLKEKLRSTTLGGSGKKSRLLSSKKVACSSILGAPGMPTAELFETYMEQVKSASKSITGHLLSLMRSAHWDIAAAVWSIIDGGGGGGATDHNPRHAKHAVESYVNRKVFHGFENETFYIEGSLTSLLRPAEFRRDCFAQFKDMRGMDPAELLGVLPTCQFGRFAAKKYLGIVHPKMEESLFGGVEQRRQVMGGAHPRTGFYAEFLKLAKAVWLLHLLAFALVPAPSHFEATKGAVFHPAYMESVVRFAGGRVPPGSVVGFSVSPGFKLGNGSVVRARVYVVPRAHGV
ncbi:protein GRAVITROPIC IN THE LIGHT 1-like [Phoenix dactylifera]|uniref:Protein GRAVITROPIC IN THE LIGHT 1-like n=1 Tax=Phoenix dactylifera TaxID=42345 RepID=A0A8B8J2H7_PHODC|nr:protein GRAVITROPIC IN THE LIGHT 1-like [Phoenix dactylifera]